VAYDVTRLTSRDVAQAFGPLATTMSGLSWRLVDRLRSITATPIAPAGTPGTPAATPGTPAATPAGTPAATPGMPAGTQIFSLPDGKPLRVTTDRGASTRAFTLCGRGGQSRTPLAGAASRVELYADTAAAVILSRIADEYAAGWGPGVRERYEAAVVAAAPSADRSAAIVRALSDEFEAAVAAAPPATPAEAAALVAGTPKEPGDYVDRALARVRGADLDATLLSMYRQPAMRAPAPAVEREARVSDLQRTSDAAVSLRRRLAAAFRAGPGDFAPVALARAFRAAAAAAVEEWPGAAASTPLKLFSAVST
jgi:hypothetical protein